MMNTAMGATVVEGNAQSPVRVVIFEDLQCSDCAKFRAMLDATLLPRFGSEMAFEHHDFPLASHSWSGRAAMVARFFDTRNPTVGIEFRRQVLARLDELQANDLAGFVAGFARQYGIDPVRAVEALNHPALAALVDKDRADGVARGVAKTPTVFVDGQPFVETFTVEAISQAIQTAIATNRKN